MSYKHGNWYCKPANDGEAREIIERAVASGAINRLKLKGTSWDFFYGTIDGVVAHCRLEYFPSATEYTITQVREKFPLQGEQQAEWNGEGLPPVGCDHEFSANGVHWEERTMLFKDDISFLTASKKFPASRWHYKVNDPDLKFRPLRTERERWVEQALNVLQKDPCAMPPQLMGMVYDAIKSGTLPAPEVE